MIRDSVLFVKFFFSFRISRLRNFTMKASQRIFVFYLIHMIALKCVWLSRFCENFKVTFQSKIQPRMKWLSNEKLDIQMISFNHIHGILTSSITFIRKAMNCLIQVHLMFMTIFFSRCYGYFSHKSCFSNFIFTYCTSLLAIWPSYSAMQRFQVSYNYLIWNIWPHVP
jgi:hypothetical protein